MVGRGDYVEVDVAHGTVRVLGPEVDTQVAAPGRYASSRWALADAPDGADGADGADGVDGSGTKDGAGIDDGASLEDGALAQARDHGRAPAVRGRRRTPERESQRGAHGAKGSASSAAEDSAPSAGEDTAPNAAEAPAPSAAEDDAGSAPDAEAAEAPCAPDEPAAGVSAAGNSRNLDARDDCGDAEEARNAARRAAMLAYRAALEAPPEEAARRLVVVAEEHAVVREVALHRAARLLKHAGQCGAALPRYEALLDEFPDGALDLERRIDRVECLRTMSRTVALRAALDDLERRDLPRTRRAEVTLMRAELAREAGDVERALAAARAVPSDTPAAANAKFLEAWALLNLGRQDEARTALRSYLDRWPAGRHAAEARAWIEADRKK
ncbi:MAG: tetratricopeptide repeat protein [Deltaproteobacteria bacterium]